MAASFKSLAELLEKVEATEKRLEIIDLTASHIRTHRAAARKDTPVGLGVWSPFKEKVSLGFGHGVFAGGGFVAFFWLVVVGWLLLLLFLGCYYLR